MSSGGTLKISHPLSSTPSISLPFHLPILFPYRPSPSQSFHLTFPLHPFPPHLQPIPFFSHPLPLPLFLLISLPIPFHLPFPCPSAYTSLPICPSLSPILHHP